MEIGIIGLGLMGGSIAKSLKKNRVCNTIVAYDSNIEVLNRAIRDKAIDISVNSIEEGFKQCDIVFICTPVEYIVSIIMKLKDNIKKSCIITDVGSTKQKIENQIINKFHDIKYIGGHPMAGLEKNGYKYSSAILLENAFYVLTKNIYIENESIEIMKDIIYKIKAIPIIVETKAHDTITSNISHVPHILAAALVNMVKNNDNKSQLMKTLAAGGFRDISRIASSAPNIWENICISNKEEILNTLSTLKKEISKFEKSIENENKKQLYKLFESAKQYRDSIDIKNTGLIEKEDINIKNIGIINNREAYEGALRIEFYNEKSMENSFRILNNLDYRVHLKD